MPNLTSGCLLDWAGYDKAPKDSLILGSMSDCFCSSPTRFSTALEDSTFCAGPQKEDSICCTDPQRFVISIQEPDFEERGDPPDKALRISDNAKSKTEEDRTHPLASPKEYCFKRAKAQAEKLREYHKTRHESFEEELERLEVDSCVIVVLGHCLLAWVLPDMSEAGTRSYFLIYVALMHCRGCTQMSRTNWNPQTKVEKRANPAEARSSFRKNNLSMQLHTRSWSQNLCESGQGGHVLLDEWRMWGCMQMGMFLISMHVRLSMNIADTYWDIPPTAWDQGKKT